jgi:integrase
VTTRRRLPPGARWVELPGGVRRVELVVDVGLDPATGKRRQTRRRFRTVTEAADAYAAIRSAASGGTYVVRSGVTVQEVIDGWLAGRHGIRPSTLAGYRDVLKPVTASYGALPVRQLSKQHVVELVGLLTAGGMKRTDGKPRRPWRPRTVNLLLFTLGQVLDDARRQGIVARNVVELVDRLPQDRKEMQTYAPAEVDRVLAAACDDRLEHAWYLALYGLRRGEVAGLPWSDVLFDEGVLAVRVTRVAVDGRATPSTPKTVKGVRRLPLTKDLAAVLRRAQKRQEGERKIAGAAWQDSGYVVTNEIGGPLHPETLSSRWDALVARAKVRRIRLHDARHTCGTVLHLQGVPTAVIAAWLGHADPAFTMRTYVHSQEESLRVAAKALRRRS